MGNKKVRDMLRKCIEELENMSQEEFDKRNKKVMKEYEEMMKEHERWLEGEQMMKEGYVNPMDRRTKTQQHLIGKKIVDVIHRVKELILVFDDGTSFKVGIKYSTSWGDTPLETTEVHECLDFKFDK